MIFSFWVSAEEVIGKKAPAVLIIKGKVALRPATVNENV
jgi:hypothetical protein